MSSRETAIVRLQLVSVIAAKQVLEGQNFLWLLSVSENKAKKSSYRLIRCLMGCAPSIHVSQSTGVVYCRDENVKALKHSRTTSLSISEVVSHIPPNQSDSLTTESRTLRIDRERESSFSARGGAWIEAETQTLEQALLHHAGMDVKVYIYPVLKNQGLLFLG